MTGKDIKFWGTMIFCLEDLLADAFRWATEEGALFYNGASAGAETTAGKLAILRGKIDDLQIRIHEATGGLLAYMGEAAQMAVPFVQLLPMATGAFSGIKSGFGLLGKSMRAFTMSTMLNFNVARTSSSLFGASLRTVGIIGSTAMRSIGAAIKSIPIIGWVGIAVSGKCYFGKNARLFGG